MVFKTTKVILIIFAIFLIAITGIGIGLYFGGWSFTIYSKDEFEKTAGQYVQINQKDEWVIVEMVNNEIFTKEGFTYLFDDYLFGESKASISLVANYKYYIKLTELTHELNDRTLTIYAPKLYLSTPVAFDSSTLIEESARRWFGKNPQELLDQLINDISEKLIIKGKLQRRNVREKATRSIAENINSYFMNHGKSRFYNDILVVFKDDKNNVQPKYEFNTGFCGSRTCRFELEFLHGKTLVIDSP